MENSDATFQSVIDRLLLATGLPDEQTLGNALGFTRSAFTVRKSRGSLPRIEIEDFCATNKINPRWVLDGEGAMYIEHGFEAKLELHDTLTKRVARMKLQQAQASLLVKLLLSLELGDRLRLRELLAQGERLSSDESLVLEWHRRAEAPVRDQTLLLARLARQEREHGPLPEWLRPPAPPRISEPLIPNPDEARLKPAEIRRLRAAKKERQK